MHVAITKNRGYTKAGIRNKETSKRLSTIHKLLHETRGALWPVSSFRHSLWGLLSMDQSLSYPSSLDAKHQYSLWRAAL